jgi:hypothetical protein
MVMTKITRPIKIGASISIRNTMIATMIINAIIPITIAAIVPPKAKMIILYWVSIIRRLYLPSQHIAFTATSCFLQNDSKVSQHDPCYSEQLVLLY